jgi:hypothetical protein
MNQHTLFTTVEACYTDLVSQLAAAEQKISMGYFSFEQGKWTDQIIQVLHKKIQAGVRVRLLVWAGLGLLATGGGTGMLAEQPQRRRDLRLRGRVQHGPVANVFSTGDALLLRFGELRLGNFGSDQRPGLDVRDGNRPHHIRIAVDEIAHRRGYLKCPGDAIL